MKQITTITHEVDSAKLDLAMAQAADLYDMYAGIREYGPFPGEGEVKPKEVALASLREFLLENGTICVYNFAKNMCGFGDIAWCMNRDTGWDVSLVVTQTVTEE
jgi:hypothetical protein